MKPVSAHLPPMTRRSERGVALVITLILLSVTLVMAVAFLAMSRREREANATNTDITQARLAAESALAAAQAQILANIYSTTNAGAYNYGMLVSTNYVTGSAQGGGFDATLGYSTNSNVNYFDGVGNLWTGANLAQNIANLQILPRAPVFVPNGNGGLDFRFYLDLNRNGIFDTNGIIGVFTNLNGVPTYSGVNTFAVGDPEWVGVLEHPDQLHSPVNKFVSRYAFFAQPIGNSLDINAIHNQSLDYKNNGTFPEDGYFRNQGVGSWELNLAAFLVDLNTDVWWAVSSPASSYYYGIAFNDAFAIYTNRLQGSYTTLTTGNNYFKNAPAGADYFQNAIDEYTEGAPGFGDPTYPWLGADNLNHYFSLPDELFNTSGTLALADPPALPAAFVNRLANAGKNLDTYDRYTFYRLLAQLGTDSSAEAGKINLNYMNVINGAVVPGMETNLIRWPDGLTFFTNAADRMLRVYSTNWFARNPSNYFASYFGVVTNYNNPDGYGLTNFPYNGITNQVPGLCLTNIPVYVRGQFLYPSAVHRLLQLAANIYDASTNDVWPKKAFFPSVFRPYFRVVQDGLYQDVFIAGYTQETNANNATSPYRIPLNLSAFQTNGNIYGVPWIVGAKKYMPNFNQFGLINESQVTRKLQFSRPDNSSLPNSTNQCYEIGVTNTIGISYWNSYQNAYPGLVNVYASDTLSMTVSNGTASDYTTVSNLVWFTNGFSFAGSAWNLNVRPSSRTVLNPNSALSFYNNFSFIPTQPFYASSGTWGGVNAANQFDSGPVVKLPAISLVTSNWFYTYMVDATSGRIIDYVQFAGPGDATNITDALADPNYPPTTGANNQLFWSTNFFGAGPASSLTLPYGVYNQIYWSENSGSAAIWPSDPGFPNGGETALQVSQFKAFMSGSSSYPGTNTQAPYSPTRTIYGSYLLQANDPLVHYLVTDLNGVPGSFAHWSNGKQQNGVWTHSDNLPPQTFPQFPSTSTVSTRYQPWGVMNQMSDYTGVVTNAFDWTFKDPGVYGADFWNFPTNLFPTVGWLGRVHRGTPWQTVYLKASDVLSRTITAGETTVAAGLNTWEDWTGDLDGFDATNSIPAQDRLLFDVFTTSINDNATRGTLSVNQNNFAAWSALFSGMTAITNPIFANTMLFPNSTNSIPVVATNINPGGVDVLSSALWNLYTNINQYRSGFANGVFTHVGDILSAPSFSEASPFLNYSALIQFDTKDQQIQYGVNDEMMEWLPQQAMSLLRVGDAPRYVIYGYGQALRPAPNGYYTASGGNFFDLVTNYQVMAETGLRAVIQVHPHVTATSSGYVTNFTTTVESYDILPPH